MLREIKTVLQYPDEPFRRWFMDAAFDLTVWHAPEHPTEIIGFQLLYPDGNERKALTWRRDKGYSHHGVDEGERRPGRAKQAAILVADGIFQKDDVTRMLAEACREIDPAIAGFVIEKLRDAL